MICNVGNCRYTATSEVESFPVCGLHDCQHVRAMLHNLQLPGHFWNSTGPMVLPVGSLDMEHFEPIEGDGDDVDTCPYLAEINFERHRGVLPRYDLLKEWAS